MNDGKEREEELFDAARRLNGVRERTAFLDEHCAGDTGLRRRLDRLLDALGESDELFRPLSGANSTPRPPIADAVGTQVGRYKLLEKIGEGGMGAVYMAEQSEPVRRKVALKIIKAGMDTRQVIARFEAERQALALMDDPNIAKVLDGGETEHGRPYFVMDLVQGLPITQFCDEAKLSTPERLELFLDVCSAIQHAHQKGIIHRDIKPTNILVTLHGDKPVPKVIDFGIAKATQQPLTDKTLFTQFQHFIGTPAYMSPEQASLSGLDIDTRSDIYALGVLLYELLAGATPFDGKELLKSGLDEMRRTIREKEPPPPSRRLSSLHRGELATTAQRRAVEAPNLIHLVRGDLDWIVMKCLEKDRARRYETAEGLAADLRRHLSDEPVAARPASAGYRFQKLVRRNKLQFAAGTFAAAALVAALAVSSWQAIRATRARNEAADQAEIARSVKDFLAIQVLGSANPFVEAVYDPHRRAVVDRVARQVEGRFTNQPLIEAEIRFALADAFDALDDYESAAAQLEKALAIRERRLRWENSDTVRTATKLSAAYSFIPNRKPDAERLALQAVAAARRTSKTLSAAGAEALAQLAYEYSQTGRPAEALSNGQEAVEALKRTLDAKDIRISMAMWTVASATERPGTQAEAERLWDEGIRHCQSAQGSNHPMGSAFLRSKANFLRRLGRPNDAVPLLQQAIAVQEQTLGRSHRWTLDSMFFLAKAYEEQKLVDRAVDSFAALGREASNALDNFHVRSVYSDAVASLVLHRRFPEAREVLERGRRFFLENRLEKPWAFESLVAATAALDGWSAAADVCRTNLESFAGEPSVWRTKASVFLYVGDTNAYQNTLARVLARAAAVTNANEAKTILEIASLGPCVLSPDQAGQCESAVRIIESALSGMPTNQKSGWHRAAGAMQLRLGRLTNSLVHFEASLTELRPGPEWARVRVLNGICLHRRGSTNEARAAFDEAEAWMKPRLLDPLEKIEGFLDLSQRTLLIQRRELSALLNLL